MANKKNDTNSLEKNEEWLNNLLPEERTQAIAEFLSEENNSSSAQDKEDVQFLDAVDDYGAKEKIVQTLRDIYKNDLSLTEDISTIEQSHGKVINMFAKYKKMTAIAACIAGLTALLITVITIYIYPAKNQSQLQQLSRDVEKIKKTQAYQSSKISEVASKVPKGSVVKSGGSAFLIDGKGYFITNAHVLKGSGAIVVNTKGQEFETEIEYIDQTRDLAVIKITDKDFKPYKSLPYSFRRSKLKLGQDVFTLGYPRNDIVYNTGYISSATGFNGDTSSIQVAMIANPGNSGGPLFNKNGEVVGVLSTRETKAEGVSFAIKTNEIFQTLEDWKKTDGLSLNMQTSEHHNLADLPRTEQIEELENYIYLVKVY